jgi:type I restriction enzyme S subunit
VSWADSWRVATLGALCAEGGGGVQTGPFGSQLHAADYVPIGVPSVMPQNIGDNTISADGIAMINDADAERLSKYRLRAGDIVYSRRGDVEKRAYVRPEQDGWLCGTGCLRVRLGEETPHDSRFISYQLGTEESRAWIVRHAVGATMPNLNTAILSGVPISAPALSEQQAIAEVLGALDDKIAANTNLIEAASGLAVALLSEHSPSVPLADVVTHQKRSLAPTDFGDSLVAHFSLPAFDAGQRPQRTLPEEIKSSKFLIEQPCVLVSKLNPRFPRIWNVVELPTALAVSSTEFLVLESTHCVPSVLWAILSQSSFSAELESKVAGTSGSHQRVRPSDLLATEVIDPRLLNDETKTQLDSLGRKTAVCREESAALASMRDALLPQLMSGKIRVTTPSRGWGSGLSD